MFLILIPLVWLAVIAFVIAACQVAARTDRRTDTELKRLGVLLPGEWSRSTVRSPAPDTRNARRGDSGRPERNPSEGHGHELTA